MTTRAVRENDPSLGRFEQGQAPVESGDEHERERDPREGDELGPLDARDPHVLSGVVDLLDTLVIDVRHDGARDEQDQRGESRDADLDPDDRPRDLLAEHDEDR